MPLHLHPILRCEIPCHHHHYHHHRTTHLASTADVVAARQSHNKRTVDGVVDNPPTVLPVHVVPPVPSHRLGRVASDHLEPQSALSRSISDVSVELAYLLAGVAAHVTLQGPLVAVLDEVLELRRYRNDGVWEARGCVAQSSWGARSSGGRRWEEGVCTSGAGRGGGSCCRSGGGSHSLIGRGG